MFRLMLRLHDVIGQQRADIVSMFEERVASARLLPADAQPSEIVDNIPSVLDAIVRSLCGCENGEAVAEQDRLAARAHGQHRRARAIDLPAVLREYAVMRECILDVAHANGVAPSVAEFACLARSIDVAVAEAVEEYAAHRDSEVVRERAGLEAERIRLRTAIALLPVAVMVTDESGRAIEVNEAMRALWASRREPLVERISESFRAWSPET